MKTIKGNAFSTKPISLSKAAKFLSNFVSSENGASQAINAYLHRASASFNELKKVHKDLNSSYSDKKHKRHTPEASHVSEAIGENPIRSVEISQERSKNKSRRHLFQSNTVEDEEKPTRSVVEFSQEPSDAVKCNESVSEKQKKKKNRESGDHTERKDEGKLTTKSKESLAWDVESGQEQGNGGGDIMGMEEGKKHKREKKKKEKDSTSNISHKEAENSNLEGKGTIGAGDQKGTEKKLPNGRDVENGGLVDTQELQSKKKKRYEAGSKNRINTEEEKSEKRTKKKNEEVEDRTEESNSRRKRRKREGDD
ncbi:hypothetical protein L6164_031864 [Bauhinia variegata]|uniref:Uncharacterized protein n=1 Tax=Bauhinia variegata TaxID=167791 RepID=A0ACB9KM11_BAUVA|nr:hypothetical protein L6164_031864 [Bauhinia variegata]